MDKPKLFIICGPTASGKSRLALEKALELEGEIVNADSIQVYKEIPILTCSPTMADKALAPHHLYNHTPIGENYSVSRYVQEATEAIDMITAREKIPIVVGGTGLYIKALSEGLSEIPEVPQELRNAVRDQFVDIGREAFYAKLQSLDPLAARLHPSNTQRIIRAYEVFAYTEKSIFDFHASSAPKSPLDKYDVEITVLIPDRSELYSRCDGRFVELMSMGVLEEVRNVMDQSSSAEKAIGFKEIRRYLRGEITREEATKQAQAKTRQYAKRQITWFKHQINGVANII